MSNPFSNFTITPEKRLPQGPAVTIKLNEPLEGFVVANDFVCGAGKGSMLESWGFSRRTHGAELQNLLKLFEAIIDGTASPVLAVPIAGASLEKVIY